MMKSLVIVCVVCAGYLAACSDYPDAPVVSLSAVDGSVIEIDSSTPVTVIYFFSVSNPVALAALYSLPENLVDNAEIVAVALDVDRPPNIRMIQEDTLVPIHIDTNNTIAGQFGGIELTPALVVVKQGKILLRQNARLEYDKVNLLISRYGDGR